MSKFIAVREDLCMACGTCRIECAVSHSEAGTLMEAVQAGEPLESRIYVEPIGRFGTPLQCQHCEDAPCVQVCPTGALHRNADGGPVLLDKDHCIVCRLCLVVCPFGVLHVSRTGKTIVKCDLCEERAEAGQEPACVSACPTGALQFTETTDYVGLRRREAAGRLASSIHLAGTVEGTPYGCHPS